MRNSEALLAISIHFLPTHRLVPPIYFARIPNAGRTNEAFFHQRRMMRQVARVEVLKQNELASQPAFHPSPILRQVAYNKVLKQKAVSF